MARLTAYGQHELARVRKEQETPDDQFVSKRIWERAFMSNGRILERLVVWFRPGPYDHGKTRRHDYRWKVKCDAHTYKDDQLQLWLDKKIQAGWTNVTEA